MTVFIVDTAGGGNFKSLAEAAKAVKPGDTVEVAPGVYREKLTCAVKDVTWRSVVKHGAIIDGGWSGTTEGTSYAPWVQVSAEGVKFLDFFVRNCPGRGINVAASDTVLSGNHVDNTYYSGIKLGTANGVVCKNVVASGNIVTRAVQFWRVAKGGGQGDGCFNIHTIHHGLVTGNIISDGWGEGINIGRGSYRTDVAKNVVHTTSHVLMYFNRCKECTAFDNILYHIPEPPWGGEPKDSYSATIIFGDERGPQVSKHEFQAGNKFIGNLVVGGGTLLHVRNNVLDTAGYDTVLEDVVIENNTFVAGPATTKGIIIQANQRGRQHKNSVFQRNVIHFTNAAPGASIASLGGSGVKFGTNAWTSRPPENMRSATDVYGDLGLARAGAVIKRIEGGPIYETTFSSDNYRPLADSPLVDKDGVSVIGALQPTAEPPPPPPPPPPDPDPEADWRELLDERQRRLVQNCELYAANDPAGLPGHQLMLLVAEMAAIMDEITELYEELAE